MEKPLKIAGVLVALGLVAYFLTEWISRKNKSEKKLKNENQALRNLLSELQEEVTEIIESKDDLNEEVKNKLRELVLEYEDLDEKVTNELLRVTSLIEIKEETKAILSLTKIIENLLKQIYKGDEEFESKYPGKKEPRLYDLIEHAKSENLLEKDEYHFLNGIREIRNQEAHELDVKKDWSIVLSALFTGIGLVSKLCGVLKNGLNLT